ncbi:MAG: glutathione S-transferase family protein [Gammaproteobacteria bacterium]|nr:glutathione S-transferase family protein [Pseudomonadales bacterium]MCP5347086.1 glutathione S-transferase family protein [Pseudomonadales bacterium]
MKLVIGNKNYSSWSLRAWLFLSWHELEFEEIRVPLYQPGSREQLLGFSAAGQVPVLLDEDLLVWDSLAICEYVSEQYLDNRGWPRSRAMRAEARSVSAEMHAGFHAIRNRLPMNARASGRHVGLDQELQAEIQRLQSLWQDLRSRHGSLGPWLFGKFSIADCFYAPMAFRFPAYGVTLTGAAADYLSLLREQPLMQNWLEAARQEQEVITFAETGIDSQPQS